MTNFSGDMGQGATGTSRPDADREWWSEPDPVELFAAGLELALRQLRVEVAGLRAERDGLRLEVEGLRAKLAIAHEQLASRESLADTVRQLQHAVARLSLGPTGASGPVDVVRPQDPAPERVIVLEPPSAPIAVEPIAVEPIHVAPIHVEPIAVGPIPVEPAPVVPVDPTPEPAAVPAPANAEPSALEQLKAMGLWPPKVAPEPTPAGAPSSDPLSAFAPPVVTSPIPEPAAAPEPVPAPSRRETPAPAGDHVVSWDRMSTRRTPVVIDDVDRFDAPPVAVTQRKRGKLRLVATGVLGIIGALVVVTVLLVSVGPRLLPYQTYFVRSGSMEPTISTGAMVVLTKTDGDRLEPGDIITFKNPEDESVLVTHRIVEIETTDQGRVFVTKGDANANADSWRVPASGTGWKYSFDVPVVGYVFGYLGTPQARLALLIIPAALLGILALLDIWRPKPGAA